MRTGRVGLRELYIDLVRFPMDEHMSLCQSAASPSPSSPSSLFSLSLSC